MALSPTALEYAQDIRYRGKPETATHHGIAGSPGGGPFFELWLTVETGVIRTSHYQTYGCPSSMAVGGGLCRLITGRDFSRVPSLTKEDVALFIGGLPEGKEFCYDLAITALMGVKEIPL